MQDLLANAETWFEAKRREHLAATVEYRPVVGAARDCKATLIVGRWEAITKDGGVTRMETRDFLIHSDDLFQEPKRGDKIVVSENGTQKTYEVSIPQGADNPWRWSDRSQTLRRIHTQLSTQVVSPPSLAMLTRGIGVFAGESITDAQIASTLSLDLATTRGLERSLAAAAQYVYVVLPASFGLPTFRINGFVTTAWQTAQRSIAFPSQAATTYVIYRSTYSVTGTLNVEVS